MIKKIFLGVLLFFFLYMDPIYFGAFKWSQIWKVILMLFMISFLFVKKIKLNKIISTYIISSFFYIISPFLFDYFTDTLVYLTTLLFFPTIFLLVYFITKKTGDYLSILSFLSIFFILSFIPFYFELLPQLGSSYDIKSLGISNEKTISGLFQKPHPASQVLAYSCLTLFYVISKTKNSKKYFLILILILGVYFQIKTFVRLGLLMTLVGAFFYYIYKTNVAKKLKSFLFAFIILILSFPFVSETNTFKSYEKRLFGENQYDYSYHNSKIIDYNKISSGRIGIWKSSINSLLSNDDPFEIIFGLTESELLNRNRKNFGLAVFSHNGFIDAFVTNGLIGILLYIYFIITWFKSIINRKMLFFKNYSEYKYVLSVFFIFLVSTLFQGGKIIYDGLFLSLSILILFSKKIQSEYQRFNCFKFMIYI